MDPIDINALQNLAPLLRDSIVEYFFPTSTPASHVYVYFGFGQTICFVGLP